jgi:hypothetical protein
MNPLKKYLTPLMAGLVVLSLSSCAASSAAPQSRSTNSPTPETTKTPAATSTPARTLQKTPAASQSPKTTKATGKATGDRATSTAQAKNKVTLNIYQADGQCQALKPEKVTVPADSPVTAAVGQVLKQADSSDFPLAGYRVQVNPSNRVATVDFRLSPNSRRQFISLSPCEQFALFGSLRKTLTDNSQLKIKDVRFTHQGKQIVL